MTEMKNPRTMAGASNVRLAGNMDASSRTESETPTVETLESLVAKLSARLGPVRTLLSAIYDECGDDCLIGTERIETVDRLTTFSGLAYQETTLALAMLDDVERLLIERAREVRHV